VMQLQGKVASTTVVKVCAQAVNAYVVSYSSSLANPSVGEIIRTNGNDANTLTIAPQLGGLVVAQHVDTDDIRLDANLGGYIGVTMTYDSTLHRLTPATS